MKTTLSFVRVLFLLFSVTLMTAYMTKAFSEPLNLFNLTVSLTLGLLFVGATLLSETLFQNFNLRVLNIATVGLFFGYLMGHATDNVLTSLLTVLGSSLPVEMLGFSRTLIYLLSLYLGLILTVKGAENIQLSIPFVKFHAQKQTKKDILIDPSILSDSRIIDLASSGLLDQILIMPRFAMKELLIQMESADEAVKTKARRSIEMIKKLESIPNLNMRYAENEVADVKDSTSKLIRLARVLDANIITADLNRIQQSSIESLEDIKIINIHMLSNALKPLTQSGEYLSIKIQRYGKEPRQGVGYLEDGTMVVVNGGAEYIGETIKCQVLSVKHTTSGRMIFCNAPDVMAPLMGSDKGDLVQKEAAASSESSHKTYFAV